MIDMTARKASAKKTETTTPEEVAPVTYIDEFYAANGSAGFEELADLPFTGKRDEDRALVVEALAARARTSESAEALVAVSDGTDGERGRIGVADVIVTDEPATEA